MPNIPESMTPDKLRYIAGWLDTYDTIFRGVVIHDEDGTKRPVIGGEGILEALEPECQRNLRSWADDIERQQTVEVIES